jgi:DNA polymerase III subunit epsilon
MNSKFNLNDDWMKYPVVTFDTETSGAYAIESEIIELGAVKWLNGEIVDRFQTLLKPSKLLVESNIRIHGITNEMVSTAPKMSEQIQDFAKFIEGSVLLAHHAPFDLGFMAIAFEKHHVPFPSTFNLCTSLLSRALIATTNHKLQTLVKELKLTGGDAHRAYDDAYACMQVFFKCNEKLAGELVPDPSLRRLFAVQGKDLDWKNYAVLTSGDETLMRLADACAQEKELTISYLSGQTKGSPRKITPLGIVRNPDGDYVHAFCHIDQQRKRFYIDKIIL